jgi:hypothetical protein
MGATTPLAVNGTTNPLVWMASRWLELQRAVRARSVFCVFGTHEGVDASAGRQSAGNHYPGVIDVNGGCAGRSPNISFKFGLLMSATGVMNRHAAHDSGKGAYENDDVHD